MNSPKKNASSKKSYETFTEAEFEKFQFEYTRSALRKMSSRWPYKTIAIQKARLRRGIYECAICRKEVPNKTKKADHKRPVVDPHRGFEGWDVYVKRLFVRADEYQIICPECHGAKTREENAVRREVKKLKQSK